MLKQITDAALTVFLLSSNIVAAQEGKAPAAVASYDPSVPYLVNGNGGPVRVEDILHRSVLMPFKDGMPPIDWPDLKDLPAGARTVEGANYLAEFCRIAITGRRAWKIGETFYNEFYFHPILELKDKSNFEAGRYWYSLTVPASKANLDGFRGAVQRDLRDAFGYKVKVETRLLPYWKLTATDRARSKLRTKGGKASWEFNARGAKITNMPWATSFVENLFLYQASAPYPFIDETGIEGNIDLTFVGQITKLDDIRKGLKALGVEMVEAKKEFKVIVVTD